MHISTVASLNYFINADGEILLQKKSRGLGVGKWNGVGGKAEPGEDILAAAKREIWEETGAKVDELTKIGYLEYIWPEQHKQKNWAVHVFKIDDWEGELVDRGEGELKWFRPGNFPVQEMWEDDQYWLADALAGKFPQMRFYLDGSGKTLRFENF
ncbi:MAG TPA: 8-oxo-dGTP diphosphatase [Candidatus Nanoarchaeia archaeon]|nr:8-oxo-dGTP diphosphatase [Candidatus Nanoarchaeia archaeon]